MRKRLYGCCTAHGADGSPPASRAEKRIEQAARLKGLSLSDFIVQHADEAAIKTIQLHTSWTLEERDRDLFVQALLNPPEPSARMKAAARATNNALACSGSSVNSGEYKVEPLAANHDRAAFGCGVLQLDAYLQRQAGQDLKRSLAAIFVLTQGNEIVAGFYTLSSHSILAEQLPQDLAKKLPRFPIPVTLLGRMAGD